MRTCKYNLYNFYNLIHINTLYNNSINNIFRRHQNINNNLHMKPNFIPTQFPMKSDNRAKFESVEIKKSDGYHSVQVHKKDESNFEHPVIIKKS